MNTTTEKIRQATPADLSRIAEILVFDKRINFRPIFRDDDYSFNALQVLKVAKDYAKPEILNHIHVYDDGIVKGLIHIEGTEIKELYVDHFFKARGSAQGSLNLPRRPIMRITCGPLRKTQGPLPFMRPMGFS